MKKYNIKKLNNNLIAKIWDDICLIRDKQIESGLDVSYNKVLEPYILNEIKSTKLNRVLDFGCGTGNLAYKVSLMCDSVVGFDISKVSIAHAVDKYSNVKNLFFADGSIDDIQSNQFDLVISNMVLQDVLDAVDCVSNIARVTKIDSKIILTFTHPCFWPLYWNYSNESWFDYNSEVAISAPFRIQNDSSVEIETIHIHRPISYYFDLFSKFNLKVLKCVELSSFDFKVNAAIVATLPKFIGFTLIKIK